LIKVNERSGRKKRICDAKGYCGMTSHRNRGNGGRTNLTGRNRGRKEGNVHNPWREGVDHKSTGAEVNVVREPIIGPLKWHEIVLGATQPTVWIAVTTIKKSDILGSPCPNERRPTLRVKGTPEKKKNKKGKTKEIWGKRGKQRGLPLPVRLGAKTGGGYVGNCDRHDSKLVVRKRLLKVPKRKKK